MKDLLIAVADRLEENIGTTVWVDFDQSQIDTTANQSQVQFPCALASMNLNECEDVKDSVQQCKASVMVRIVFDERNLAEVSTAEEARNRSLPQYELLENVYLALQGFEADGFGSLERISQIKEDRTDGLFVYRLTFHVSYMDLSASV